MKIDIPIEIANKNLKIIISKKEKTMKSLTKGCLLLFLTVLFYSCNKEINNEKNHVEEQDFIFENNSVNMLTEKLNEVYIDVLSLDSIISAQGYYIQQAEKRYNNGRSPEILALSVEDGKVFIREIDVLNKQKIARNEIELHFDGRSYVHYNTKLTAQNNIVQIIYLEHKLENYWTETETWDYDIPYTFACDFDSNMSDNIYRLTSDYLITFTGQYVFDSHEIISQINSHIDIKKLENSFIQITYNHEKKCLSFNLNYLENYQANFVETTINEPFYWSYGESAGYTESMLYFNEGGVTYSYKKFSYTPDESEEYIIEYVAFFKKRT